MTGHHNEHTAWASVDLIDDETTFSGEKIKRGLFKVCQQLSVAHCKTDIARLAVGRKWIEGTVIKHYQNILPTKNAGNLHVMAERPPWAMDSNGVTIHYIPYTQIND